MYRKSSQRLKQAYRLQYCEPLCYELSRKQFFITDEDGYLHCLNILNEEWLNWGIVGTSEMVCRYQCLKLDHGLYLLGLSVEETPSACLGLILDTGTDTLSWLEYAGQDEILRLRCGGIGRESLFVYPTVNDTFPSCRVMWRLAEDQKLLYTFCHGHLTQQLVVLGADISTQDSIPVHHRILKIRKDNYLLLIHGSELKELGKNQLMLFHAGTVRAVGCGWLNSGETMSNVMFSAYGAFLR